VTDVSTRPNTHAFRPLRVGNPVAPLFNESDSRAYPPTPSATPPPSLRRLVLLRRPPIKVTFIHFLPFSTDSVRWSAPHWPVRIEHAGVQLNLPPEL
jgi:hypothetical protein